MRLFTNDDDVISLLGVLLDDFLAAPVRFDGLKKATLSTHIKAIATIPSPTITILCRLEVDAAPGLGLASTGSPKRRPSSTGILDR